MSRADDLIWRLQSRISELEGALIWHEEQPSAGVVVHAIQQAVESVQAPEGMTASRSEYFKAGARATVRAVNSALKEVARINPCRAQSVQRCQCCGYLVTESEHRGCLRSAAVAVPDGYVMVPVKPSAGMIGAVFPLTGESEAMRTRVNIRALNWYRAMLAAAPSAQQKESE